MEENESVVQEVDNVGPIQRYYHEQEVSRLERHNKRWFIAWLITFLLLVCCVAGFIWYEAQFQDEVITVEATQTTEGGGNNYALGGDLYGAAESQSDGQAENP